MISKDRVINECIYQVNVQRLICSQILSGKVFPNDAYIGSINYPNNYFWAYSRGLDSVLADLRFMAAGRLQGLNRSDIDQRVKWVKLGYDDGYNYGYFLYKKNLWYAQGEEGEFSV